MSSDKTKRKKRLSYLVMAQIYKTSKLMFSDKNRNQRLRLSPCAGATTGLFKNNKNTA